MALGEFERVEHRAGDRVHARHATGAALAGHQRAAAADVYYATFILVDVVGPPSAEFCRTVANFPQVDDLRFINPWEV
jgi:hypothetical protein